MVPKMQQKAVEIISIFLQVTIWLEIMINLVVVVMLITLAVLAICGLFNRQKDGRPHFM